MKIKNCVIMMLGLIASTSVFAMIGNTVPYSVSESGTTTCTPNDPFCIPAEPGTLFGTYDTSTQVLLNNFLQNFNLQIQFENGIGSGSACAKWNTSSGTVTPEQESYCVDSASHSYMMLKASAHYRSDKSILLNPYVIKMHTGGMTFNTTYRNTLLQPNN